MSHRCIHIAEDGKQCGFHLPDSYPLPVCPWHFVDTKKDNSLLAIAVGVGIGVTAMLAAQVAPKLLKKFESMVQKESEPTDASKKEKEKIEQKDTNVINFEEALKHRKGEEARKKVSKL